MPFELSRRFARLPRWSRLLCELLASALFTGLVLGMFGLAAMGPGEFESTYLASLGEHKHWVALGLFAVLSVLTAVLGNAAYERFHAWEESRLPSVREFFHNHDLTRLVGHSLGMILRATAERIADGGDARAVHAMAARAERDWPDIAATPEARRFLQGLGDAQLLAFVRDPRRPALTEVQAGLLLDLLSSEGAERRFAAGDTETQVRAEVSARFSEALRQALKRDFAKRGEAAFGMLLDIAGELLNAGAAGVARTAENDAAIRAAAATLGATAERLKALDEKARRRHRRLAEGLIATHRAVREEGRASAARDAKTHDDCETRLDAFRAAQGPAALNVSQAATLPVSIPRLNHATRWAEVPWVKLSGTA